MGGLATWESVVGLRAGEHDHRYRIVHIAETKDSADDKFDFTIGGLGACVGEPEHSSGNDSREVAFDFLAQFPKRGNSVPLDPSHPQSALAISSGPVLSVRRKFSLRRLTR